MASTGAAQAVAAVGAMFSTVGDYCSLDEGLGATGARLRPGVAGVEPLPVPGRALEHAGGRLLRAVEEAGRFHRDARPTRAWRSTSSALRGVVFAPEGLLKLVFEKGPGGSWACTLRGPVHNSTFAAIRPTHWLICIQVGADACELIRYGMELVRAERTIQSVLEATYSAVTFHEARTVAARAGMDPKGVERGDALQALHGPRGGCPSNRGRSIKMARVNSIYPPGATPRHLGDLLALVPRDAVVDVVDLLRHVDQVERDVNRDQVRPRGPNLRHDVQTQQSDDLAEDHRVRQHVVGKFRHELVVRLDHAQLDAEVRPVNTQSSGGAQAHEVASDDQNQRVGPEAGHRLARRLLPQRRRV